MSARIATANRLTDGAVVYRDASGAWVERFAAAAVAEGEPAQQALLDAAERDVAARLVVSAYLIDVAPGPAPLSQRERIRAAGPTVAYGTVLAAEA